MSTSAVTLTTEHGTFKAVGLISAAHFISHFYLLLVPPLFPILKDAFGVGYTELGLALTTFGVTTALTQAPVGFLVDRVGARRILMAGLVLEALAFMAMGAFGTFAALVAFMAVAGLANSVYHPADYAILNSSVEGSRIGSAFAVHTAAGMFGNAVAPVVMVALLTVFDWKQGLVICGAGGLAVAVLTAVNLSALRDPTPRSPGPPGPGRTGWRLLFSAPILLGVLFFVGISVAGQGINSFSVATLNVVHGISVSSAATVLSAYLFASPVGVLAGGWVADRIRRHDVFAAACFVVIALAIFAVAGAGLGLREIAICFAVAGFFSGAVSPSRDMIIRSLTPASEMGKVFGFVSTGFNIGVMVGPVLYGSILDHADPCAVFWTVGLVSALSIFTVITTGRHRHSGY